MSTHSKDKPAKQKPRRAGRTPAPASRSALDAATRQGTPLHRMIRVDGIRDGLTEIITPTDAERAEIASLQDLQALPAMSFTYTLRHISGGGLRLKGRLEADVVQTCVVSLDPVPAHLDVDLEAEFWPPAVIEQTEAENPTQPSPLADWPEPIQDGKIDLGPIIYESLATALDPYPRKQGARVDWPEEDGDEQAKKAGQGPFAALERLKRP